MKIERSRLLKEEAEPNLNIKARYNPKYTAREVANGVKAELDDLIKKLVEKYGLSVLKSATVMKVFKDEPYFAIREIENNGSVKTNAERWGN